MLLQAYCKSLNCKYRLYDHVSLRICRGFSGALAFGFCYVVSDLIGWPLLVGEEGRGWDWVG
jgi:hypothetical protein